MTAGKIRYFKSPAALRKWFERNHATARELWVGYHKKQTGRPSVTWPESVNEALCVGWIDGVRKSVDDARYTIRFTPRRSGSIWSAINISRVEALAREGRMRQAGLDAYQARRENKSGIYSYENRPEELVDPYASIFRQNKAAWEFFQAQPPSYRKSAGWWILSGKKEETRIGRVEKLIEASASGKRLQETAAGHAHPAARHRRPRS